MKNEIQKAADSIDCDFYRVYCRAESLYAQTKERSLERDAIVTFLHYLREARPHIRKLMAEEDRSATA